MLTATFKRKLVKMGALATIGALAMPLLSSGPAQADPRAHVDQLVGVGSDTIQDVFNAFAGQTAGNYYTPVHSNAVQFSSWDALAPSDHTNLTCIATRVNFNSFPRPNGSTEGKAALSRAIDGTNFTETSGAPSGGYACNNKPTSGEINFGRSSSGAVSTTDTNDVMRLVPFARDAIGVAYSATSGTTPVTSFTIAQLDAIFTENGTAGGAVVVNGVNIYPCDIQHGSGTQKDFPGLLVTAGASHVTAASIDTASGVCRGITDGADGAGVDGAGRLEEHHSDQLAHKAAAASAPANSEFIIGHSASTFIAQSNTVAPSHLNSNASMASIDFGSGAVAPFTGTAPNLVANASFYTIGAGGVGRFVYTVWPTSVLTGPGNADAKAMVVGSSSKLCQATSTITLFGLLQDTTNCGDITRSSGSFNNPA